MSKVTIHSIINTSIVTAFTIAAALIWKDVIEEFILIFVPSGSLLLSKFIVAVLATIFVVVAIYAILKTEQEAESVMKKLNNRGKK